VPASPYPVCLDDAHRAEPESVARRATAPFRLVLRARIVLLAADGLAKSCADIDAIFGTTGRHGHAERPVPHGLAQADQDRDLRTYRQGGVRLSRAQDVVGCVAVPGHSPADSWLGCIFIHRRLRRELTILPQIGHVFLVFTMRAQGPFRHGGRIDPGSWRAQPASAGSS